MKNYNMILKGRMQIHQHHHQSKSKKYKYLIGEKMFLSGPKQMLNLQAKLVNL